MHFCSPRFLSFCAFLPTPRSRAPDTPPGQGSCHTSVAHAHTLYASKTGAGAALVCVSPSFRLRITGSTAREEARARAWSGSGHAANVCAGMGSARSAGGAEAQGEKTGKVGSQKTAFVSGCGQDCIQVGARRLAGMAGGERAVEMPALPRTSSSSTISTSHWS